MNIKMSRFLQVLVAVTMIAGCAFAQNQIIAEANKQSEITPVSSTEKNFQERRPRYKLQAGDAFDIAFELNPEFNQTVTVQPDGYITLRGIGDVPVKGLTVPELTETLRSDYGKTLNNPLVSVILRDFEKPYFVADGQVGHPGKYDLRGDITLTEAIAISGGFLESAKHSQVLLFRKASQGWYSAQIFNIKKMEKKGSLKEDPTLQAGDMLFVPKNRYSKIKPFIPGSSMGAFVPLQP